MKKLFSLLLVAVSLVAFSHSASAADTVTKKRVKTPAGVVYEVTTTKSDNGVENSVITAVFAQVKNSATGQTVDVPVSSVLVGATITGVSGSSAANIVITPAGSTTPLTSTQVASSLNASVQVAIQTAIQTGTLPPTTTLPVITAASVGSGTVTVSTPLGGSGNGGNSNPVQKNDSKNPDQQVSSSGGV